MVLIEINIGDEIKTLRGTRQGRWELCTSKPVKDEMVLFPEVYYSTLELMITYILKCRIARSDAQSLRELKDVTIREHGKLHDMFSGFVSEIEEVEGIEREEEEEEKPVRRSRRRKTPRKKKTPSPAIEEEEEDEETEEDDEEEEQPRRRSRRRRNRR